MELPFFNKAQALSYFNNITKLNTDERTFLIYCFENNIPVKYKALKEFEAIQGFVLSENECMQYIQHKSKAVTSGYKVDTTIFAKPCFNARVSTLCYKFFKDNFPHLYDSDDDIARMNALSESGELIRETEEYKALLKEKDYLDRLQKIKTGHVLFGDTFNGGALVFHKEDKCVIKKGVYDFFDQSFNTNSVIESIITSTQGTLHDYSVPDTSRLFTFDSNFYLKIGKTDSFLNGCKRAPDE